MLADDRFVLDLLSAIRALLHRCLRRRRSAALPSAPHPPVPIICSLSVRSSVTVRTGGRGFGQRRAPRGRPTSNLPSGALSTTALGKRSPRGCCVFETPHPLAAGL